MFISRGMNKEGAHVHMCVCVCAHVHMGAQQNISQPLKKNEIMPFTAT